MVKYEKLLRWMDTQDIQLHFLNVFRRQWSNYTTSRGLLSTLVCDEMEYQRDLDDRHYADATCTCTA